MRFIFASTSTFALMVGCLLPTICVAKPIDIAVSSYFSPLNERRVPTCILKARHDLSAASEPNRIDARAVESLYQWDARDMEEGSLARRAGGILHWVRPPLRADQFEPLPQAKVATAQQKVKTTLQKFISEGKTSMPKTTEVPDFMQGSKPEVEKTKKQIWFDFMPDGQTTYRGYVTETLSLMSVYKIENGGMKEEIAMPV
ncbi:hypothetical protein GYMLUDRAFT_55853 [Collybiopsis luxurians FD-317 M1]|nr:hypothetical protein GYMLUDRAFT_55853 [Collybiopsis luxurians FD-317 M1]